MYQLAIVSLVLALIAASLGFAKMVAISWGGTFFFIFLALAVCSFLGGMYRARYC